jgi:hypothetical protein
MQYITNNLKLGGKCGKFGKFGKWKMENGKWKMENSENATAFSEFSTFSIIVCLQAY